ncbi:hypothetical protein M758_12G111900 [Ceratodon purpureus]|nr:hypothetical protein M758_12G111900 [Ceratodon purpureus]
MWLQGITLEKLCLCFSCECLQLQTVKRSVSGNW